jgi:hypothetical protein
MFSEPSSEVAMTLLLPLAIALLILPAPARGAPLLLSPCTDSGIRKCRSHDLPGHITVVDGEIVADYRGVGVDTAETRHVLPHSPDVVSVEVRCLLVRSEEKESGWALRSAIVVVTRAGAQRVAQTQLAELVDEQRLHLERTGRHAASLQELRFTDTRASLGIELTVSDDGWSAAVAFEDLGFACRVAVGGAAAADPELRPGLPLCAPMDAARN